MTFNFICLMMNKYLNNLYPLKIFIFFSFLIYTRSIIKTFNSSLKVFIISTFASLISVILKFSFAHELPEIVPIGMNSVKWNIIRNNTFAFPSGHTIVSTTFILSFFIEFIKLKKISFNKIIFLSIFAFFLIFFNSYRILYFGYHFLEDVIFAIFISFMNIFIFYKLKIFNNLKKIIYLFFLSWLLFFIALILSYYKMKKGGLFEIKMLTVTILLYYLNNYLLITKNFVTSFRYKKTKKDKTISNS
jgi:membrane-associated phospholipid phosphatase